MQISILLILLVFMLGITVGALLVNLQRECALERIRTEFEDRLAFVSDIQRTQNMQKGSVGGEARTVEASKSQDDNLSEEEETWNSMPVPPANDVQSHLPY